MRLPLSRFWQRSPGTRLTPTLKGDEQDYQSVVELRDILGPAGLSVGAFVAAIVSGGWFIFPKAVRAARKLSPDMNLLMTVAVAGAAVIGEWSEAGAVTFLFALAELLESFSVNRARRAIQWLLKLAPETALLKRAEHFEEVPVQQVQVGELIACPCALVISTPVSIVSGLTALARRGVLIKGGAVLEAVGKLTALATDKTGTITEGQPRVTRVIPLNATPEKEILRIAAAIDVHSEHPLAQAVVKYARDKSIEFPRSENYQARSGRGAEAELDGHHYFVGNHRFTHELAGCSEEVERTLGEIEAQAQSVVVVGHKPHADCQGEVLGVLAVGDAVRPNAAAAVRSLHRTGVRQVIMLSGDNQRTVDAIARQVGIDEAQGDLLPDQKIERVRELMKRHKHVGMVGDGVNDAPAMAAASVGIAMGAAGTDTAIETADMALMKDDLSMVAEAIRLGHRTVRVIQTNIAFALGVKAVFLVLALLGQTSLWLAILADTGATLVVISNALRLLKRK